jgi:hypothetical protein
MCPVHEDIALLFFSAELAELDWYVYVDFSTKLAYVLLHILPCS